MVHSVVLLLAPGAGSAGALSDCVAGAVAVPHPGVCFGGSAGIAEGYHSSAGTITPRATPRLVRRSFKNAIPRNMKKTRSARTPGPLLAVRLQLLHCDDHGLRAIGEIAAGHVEFLLPLRGREFDAVVSAAVPDLAQEVLVATLMENQLRVLVLRSLDVHGRNQEARLARLQVPYRDDLFVDGTDLIPALGHRSFFQAESEGHICPDAVLCLGHWYADHQGHC